VGETPVALLRHMYLTMLRIRRFEERVADLTEAGEIKTPCHLYIGQEAIAAGVCAALRADDYILGTHRSHGHYLAKGGDMQAMMAEIHGKRTGCSRGRGGSMHLIAPEVGMLGTVPIVSGTIPLAVGAALASTLQGRDRVAVAFFGDGAMEEGTTHESLNLAAHRRLPVLFVCENNLYSSHLSLLERRALDNIVGAAAAHGMVGVCVDGNDVEEVYRVVVEAVTRARAGAGPTFLECRTYRWRGHVGPSWDLDVGVKRKDELKDWLDKDPVARARERLTSRGTGADDLDRLDSDARTEVARAEEFARRSPYPGEGELSLHVFYHGEGSP
jgi:pyruvate dehydrogenase E1 component alpha subunit